MTAHTFTIKLIAILVICTVSFSSLQFAQAQTSSIPENNVILRVNLILLRNNQGQGGWDENNEEHLNVLNGAIGWMNGYLSSNGEIRNPDCYDKGNCYPKRSSADYSYIKHAKIRFQIGEIFSFNNTKYWDNYDCQDFEDDKSNPLCPDNGLQYRCPNDEYSGNWYLNPLSQKINRDADVLPAINIFFSEDGDEYIPFVVNKDCSSPRGRFRIQDCSERPDESIDKEQRVHMRSQFLKYSHLMNCKVCADSDGEEYQFIGTDRECCIRSKMMDNIIDGLSRALLHELGHSLDFTAGHCSLCPGQGLMHASKSGRSLHPNEIENAHKMILTTNLKRYVISEKAIVIDHKDQKWNRFLNLHKNYIIRNGKSLVLTNELNILSGNEISIEKGEIVIDENASIKIEEDSRIIVHKGGSLIIKSGANIDVKEGGKIVVKCGGVLKIEEHVNLKYTGIGELYQYPCNELKGPSIIENEATTYYLPFSVPEKYVSWSVFPERMVNYTTEENSITVIPINNAEGNILIKASSTKPYGDLWSTKIVWVGDDGQLIKFISVATDLLIFQMNQATQHVGIGSPIIK